MLISCAGFGISQTQTASRPSPKTKVSDSLDQLTQPSSVPVVPNPSKYDPAKLEAVNELHDYQIKDLLSRVSALESVKTWIIGLSAGLGLVLGVIVWLRHDIVHKLVSEAFEKRNSGPPPPPRGTQI